MILNGVRSDSQGIGDFLITEAPGDEAQNFPLPESELWRDVSAALPRALADILKD